MNLLPVSSAKYTWGSLWRIVKKRPAQLTWLVILFIASSVAGIFTPLIIGQLIDQTIAGQLTGFPWGALVFILVALVVTALIERLWTVQSQVLGTKLNQEISDEVMESALSLNAQTIEDAGSGDLLTRITTDVDSVRQSVTEGIPELSQTIVHFLVVTVTISVLSPAMAVVMVPMLLIMALLMRYFLPRISQKVALRVSRTSDLTTVVTENVRGSETIKELGIVGQREQVFARRNASLYEAADDLLVFRSRFWGLDALNSYLPIMLTVSWGAYAVSQGWTTWGIVSTVSLLVFDMREYNEILSYWIDSLRETSVTMGRIFGVIELAKLQDGERSAAFVPAAIATENVVDVRGLNFAYQTDQPVLEGLNFALKPGESVALMGRSGSGKTTLARLISGSLTANYGTVHVMGEPVGNGKFPTEHATDERPKLLVCTQEAHVFIGSLAENLRLVAPAATEQEMLQALESVGARWIADLPEALETQVGKGNHELTRDQIQQLALARIVLANPHIVVLDESTTHLELSDATESLRAVFQGRAVIIISHDNRIANLADRKIMLEDGKVSNK